MRRWLGSRRRGVSRIISSGRLIRKLCVTSYQGKPLVGRLIEVADGLVRSEATGGQLAMRGPSTFQKWRIAFRSSCGGATRARLSHPGSWATIAHGKVRCKLFVKERDIAPAVETRGKDRGLTGAVAPVPVARSSLFVGRCGLFDMRVIDAHFGHGQYLAVYF